MRRISLCIPHIFKYTKQHEIVCILNSIKLGNVERIDLIQSSTTQQQAFIHMSSFNDLKYPELRDQINKGNTFKIYYDYPFYWKVSKSIHPIPPHKAQRATFIKYNKSIINIREIPQAIPDQGCGIFKRKDAEGAGRTWRLDPRLKFPEFIIGDH